MKLDSRKSPQGSGYRNERPCTAISDVRGDVTLFAKASSDQVLENYARAVIIEMGGSTGLASPMLGGAKLKRTAAPGTLTLARDIGKAVREARKQLADPVESMLSVADVELLFRGKITSVERRMTKGFSRGEIEIQGMGSNLGETRSIEFQDEELIARRHNDIIATVSDLISIVDANSAEPITTEVPRYGLRVVVLRIPAPGLLRTELALHVVGPAAFGYDVEYRHPVGTYGIVLQRKEERSAYVQTQ